MTSSMGSLKKPGCVSSSCSPTSWPTAPAFPPARRSPDGCVPWPFWRRCGGRPGQTGGWRMGEHPRDFLGGVGSWNISWNMVKHHGFSHQMYGITQWVPEFWDNSGMRCLENWKTHMEVGKNGAWKKWFAPNLSWYHTKAHAEPFLCLWLFVIVWKTVFGKMVWLFNVGQQPINTWSPEIRNIQRWRLRSNRVHW